MSAAAPPDGPPRLLDALPEEARALLEDIDDAKSQKGLLRILRRHGLADGIDESQLSRRFQIASRAMVEELNTRSLEGFDIAAVITDAFGVGGKGNGDKRTLLWAVGVTMDGHKVPLGLVEDEGKEDETKKGSIAEDEGLVTKLVENLGDRGLDANRVLWVVDGGSGLRAGLGRMVRQRCIVHKTRNVLREHLAPDERKVIGKPILVRMQKAWAEPDPEKAKAQLTELSEWLDERARAFAGERRKRFERAAASVLEGIDDTLRLKRMGIDDPELWYSLSTTNAIESIHSRIADWTKGTVSYWRSDMRMRFAAAGIATAELRWGKVKATRAQLERMCRAVLRESRPEAELSVQSSDVVAATEQPALVSQPRPLPGWHRTRRARKAPSSQEQVPAAAPPDGSQHLLDALPEDARVLLEDVDDAKSQKGLLRILKRHGLGGRLDATRLSERFVAASRAAVEELNTRSLEDLNIAAIVVDGFGVGGAEDKRTLLWALGITMDGRKVPLGMVEDEREKASVAEPAALMTKLVKQLRSQGLDISDVLWVIDGGSGLRAGLNRMTRQRCIVHKSRNVVREHMPAEDSKEIGKEVLERMQKAWAEPDPKKAKDQLTGVSKFLRERAETFSEERRKRLERASASVLEGIDDTLRLKQMGIGDPQLWEELWYSLSTTNAIESIHSRIAEWTKGTVTRWQSDMRMRFAAAGIATAEPRWNEVKASRSQLEEMTLAVLRGRYPKAELSVQNAEDRVTVSGLAVTSDARRSSLGALRALARWGDRNRTPVEIAPVIVAAMEKEDQVNLQRWRREHGFEPAGDGEQQALVRQPRRPDAPRRRRIRDPLPRLRGKVGDELLVAVAGRALQLTPEVAELSPEQLGAELDRTDEACQSLLSLEQDRESWWEGRWEQTAPRPAKQTWQRAAAQIAVGKVQAQRQGRDSGHDLAGNRWRLLGASRARELMREAAYFEGLLSTRPGNLHDREREVGQPLGELDQLAERLESAAKVVAAAQEWERRELVTSARRRVRGGRSAPAPAPPGERSAATPVEAAKPLRRALGERRFALFEQAVAAVTERLQREGLGKAVLEALQGGITSPWTKRLDARNALQTRDLEDSRKRGGLELEKVSRERGRSDGRGERGLAEERREESSRISSQLGEIDEQLASLSKEERSLDRFAVDSPETVLDVAIDEALARDMELEIGSERALAAVGQEM